MEDLVRTEMDLARKYRRRREIREISKTITLVIIPISVALLTVVAVWKVW